MERCATKLEILDVGKIDNDKIDNDFVTSANQSRLKRLQAGDGSQHPVCIASTGYKVQ